MPRPNTFGQVQSLVVTVINTFISQPKISRHGFKTELMQGKKNQRDNQLNKLTIMATTNAQPNQFSLTGFVAVDATIKSFDKSAVARFPMSVSRRESKGEEVVRKSSLINCEVWSANAESKRFALLKKGQLVVINGYIKPENYTDRNGVEQSRITFVCTSVASPSTEKKLKAKAEKPVEAVTEETPF